MTRHPEEHRSGRATKDPQTSGQPRQIPRAPVPIVARSGVSVAGRGPAAPRGAPARPRRRSPAAAPPPPVARRDRSARAPARRAGALRPFGSARAEVSSGTAAAADGPMRPSVRAARQRRSGFSLRSASTRTPTAAGGRGPDARERRGHYGVRVVARQSPRERRHRRLGRLSEVPEAPRGERDHVAVRAPERLHEPWHVVRGQLHARQGPRRLARGRTRFGRRAPRRGTASHFARRGRARRGRRRTSARTAAEPFSVSVVASAEASAARSPSTSRRRSRGGSPFTRRPLAYRVSATKRGAASAQVVVVEERRGTGPAERRQQVEAAQPLGRAERSPRAPAPRPAERPARPGSGTGRRPSRRQPRPLRPPGAARGPRRRSASIAARTRGRVGRREEALDVVDLAALRVHREAHESRAFVEAGEPLRRTREVVEQLRDVVEADGEDRLVRPVLPRDALPGDPLLPGGPAPERDVHHLDPPSLRAEPGLEPLRVRLLRPDLGPERHAVPEDRDAAVRPRASRASASGPAGRRG